MEGFFYAWYILLPKYDLPGYTGSRGEHGLIVAISITKIKGSRKSVLTYVHNTRHDKPAGPFPA
jgi:hypothetical protein